MEYLLIKKQKNVENPLDLDDLCVVFSAIDTPRTKYVNEVNSISYKKRNNDFKIEKKSRVLNPVLSGEISQGLISKMENYGIEFLKINPKSN